MADGEIHGKYIYGFFHVFPGDDDGDIFNVDIFRGEYMPKKWHI